MKDLFVKLGFLAACIVVYGIGCVVIGAVIADSTLLYIIWAIILVTLMKKVEN